MDSYLAAIERYGSFQGRSSRAEFWQYWIVRSMISILCYAIVAVLFGPKAADTAASLVNLFHILPDISVTVRRLHDTDRSGGWFWILLTVVGFVVLFIYMCEAGTPGDNRYGRNSRNLYGRSAQPGAYNQMLPSAAARDPITELERLAKLRADGSLSDAEYQMMKTRALARSL